MCGILLHYATNQNFCNELLEFEEGFQGSKSGSSNSSQIFNAIVPYVAARGPNFSSLRVSEEHCISWFSSVLSLREPFIRQSVEVGDRYILQFNGELYNEEILDNDTSFVASLLENDKMSVFEVISFLEGEFAYTIYDMHERKLYFGRDDIGKRSLSYRLDQVIGDIYVASVTGQQEGFTDCLAGIVYIYDVEDKSLNQQMLPILNREVSSEIIEDEDEFQRITHALYEQLKSAIVKRVESIHPMHLENSPIAVLFSGGLDCSVIAAMICQQLENQPSRRTVELLNVSFENYRTGLSPHDTPDRKLAVKSANALKQLFPSVDIKLVEIDVPYETYEEHRPKVIDLMYPKNTEMDLSISIAFYFASKGSGYIDCGNGQRKKYQRQGIVLFSGLGADELYGGYYKFARKSTDELVEELTRQINNIYNRNLNRDDKVIAANGVEVRYPFLDRHVIEFSMQSIPINWKINKLILRKLALEKLNLNSISEEPKRAIQFGSKSAKMTKDGNRHGTDVLK
ncbi:hypothetical protein ZYGR_0A00250 [Zygosaccharomyces rouxii]|uniref:Asparagine synthase (glutamine-hydrolyzing) n=1 Tax=Zygosaccharomyces rouxii TaxID=4956 RepID=A0A1Q2ZST7_ZYGRO|nr:hypothetical protein ZYGR_0A00250 [Zygosaccharomyces rouxii]